MLIIGIIMFTGFVLGELVAKIKLPKVTGYILAGILLNPGLFGFIPRDFVGHTGVATNICLAFITFSVERQRLSLVSSPEHTQEG